MNPTDAELDSAGGLSEVITLQFPDGFSSEPFQRAFNQRHPFDFICAAILMSDEDDFRHMLGVNNTLNDLIHRFGQKVECGRQWKRQNGARWNLQDMRALEIQVTGKIPGLLLEPMIGAAHNEAVRPSVLPGNVADEIFNGSLS